MTTTSTRELVPYSQLTKAQQSLVWAMHECDSIDSEYSNAAVLNRLVRKGWARTFTVLGQFRRNGKPTTWYTLTMQGEATIQIIR